MPAPLPNPTAESLAIDAMRVAVVAQFVDLIQAVHDIHGHLDEVAADATAQHALAAAATAEAAEQTARIAEATESSAAAARAKQPQGRASK